MFSFITSTTVSGLAMLQVDETGVYADAGVINETSLFAQSIDPTSVLFTGTNLFGGGPVPPELNPATFYGSAVVTSDNPITAVVNVTQRNVTQIVPNGNAIEISTGTGSQTTFQIQNASNPNVEIVVSFQSSPKLVVPKGGPSGSTVSTGTSASISVVNEGVPSTPIDSFGGFAQLGFDGSATVTSDFSIVGVVNDTSTVDEHQKTISYADSLSAIVSSDSTVQVKSSVFCISNLGSTGFTTAASAYSCFDNNTFTLEISSTDPTAQFQLVNFTPVPEPNAFICMAAVGGVFWLGRQLLQSEGN